MRKIICIANQKGGVGKTTTAINLSSSLATAEKRVLLIDVDPQGNTTSGMGIDKASIVNKNLYHALIGRCSLEEIIVKTQIPTLDVAPSNQDLVGVEIEFGKTGSGSKKSASKAWEGTAWASFAIGGAAMITGTVRWILSPGDKAWAEQHQVSAAPMPDGRGAVVVFQGSW